MEKLDRKQNKRIGKTSTRNTQLTYNAALKLVFDEAVYKGFMVKLNRPKLIAKGEASERRIEFDLDETRAVKSNFDEWIEAGKADSKELRKLL